MTYETPDRSMATIPENNTARVIFAYKLGALAVVTVGIVWFAAFVWLGMWLIAISELAFAAFGLLALRFAWSGRLRAALILTEVGLFAFAVYFCLMFDTPTENYQRVSHIYLLPLAMLGYVNYVRGRSPLQLGMVAACLAGFVVFSSGDFSLPFAQPIPDDVRIYGSWINSILATSLAAGLVYVLQLEFNRRRGVARELRSALRHGQMELFLQPQVDRSGDITGCEALLRWRHPTRGYVPPADFIPVAEESGFMPDLGAWVIDEACRLLAAWRGNPELEKLTIAVNVSTSQFMLDTFERDVLATIARHGIDPGRLKLELTESVAIAGMDTVVAKMNTLRAAGIGLAVDDFGTGYSSLSYLRQLPLHQLKIDRSFVQECEDGGRCSALVRSIIQIGCDLDLVVLAEGVETAEQYLLLRESGCHEFQGYYFGKPMPRDTFEQHVRSALEEQQIRDTARIATVDHLDDHRRARA